MYGGVGGMMFTANEGGERKQRPEERRRAVSRAPERAPLPSMIDGGHALSTVGLDLELHVLLNGDVCRVWGAIERDEGAAVSDDEAEGEDGGERGSCEHIPDRTEERLDVPLMLTDRCAPSLTPAHHPSTSPRSHAGNAPPFR